VARRIEVPVQVALRRGGAEPATFTWQGRCYAVERVEGCWKEVGPWWDGEGERTFFRVTARPRVPGLHLATGVYELRFDHGREEWWLHEVVD
jgi:uncharacterized protein DUF6504